jgi:hypothetical protein
MPGSSLFLHCSTVLAWNLEAFFYEVIGFRLSFPSRYCDLQNYAIKYAQWHLSDLETYF